MGKVKKILENADFENIKKMLARKNLTKVQNDIDYIIQKLWKVFKDGYRPSRGRESYNYELFGGGNVLNFTNCLEHACFNLKNIMFDDYKINPPKTDYCTYFGFMMMYGDLPRTVARRIVDFIKETGLKIEECDPNKPIKDFKSWRMALYTSDDDYHLLLQDKLMGKKTQIWTSKNGFGGGFSEEVKGELPLLVRGDDYSFYGAYKISNPNFDENNPYVM